MEGKKIQHYFKGLFFAISSVLNHTKTNKTTLSEDHGKVLVFLSGRTGAQSSQSFQPVGALSGLCQATDHITAAHKLF